MKLAITMPCIEVKEFVHRRIPFWETFKHLESDAFDVLVLGQQISDENMKYFKFKNCKFIKSEPMKVEFARAKLENEAHARGYTHEYFIDDDFLFNEKSVEDILSFIEEYKKLSKDNPKVLMQVDGYKTKVYFDKNLISSDYPILLKRREDLYQVNYPTNRNFPISDLEKDLGWIDEIPEEDKPKFAKVDNKIQKFDGLTMGEWRKSLMNNTVFWQEMGTIKPVYKDGYARCQELGYALKPSWREKRSEEAGLKSGLILQGHTCYSLIYEKDNIQHIPDDQIGSDVYQMLKDGDSNFKNLSVDQIEIIKSKLPHIYKKHKDKMDDVLKERRRKESLTRLGKTLNKTRSNNVE